MTQRMTPKKRMNSLLLKQTSEMIVWGGNKRLLWKRKIRWYITPMKVQNLSSFEKQKEYIWHFSETPTKRQTDIKKHITSANERDKAHF